MTIFLLKIHPLPPNKTAPVRLWHLVIYVYIFNSSQIIQLFNSTWGKNINDNKFI